MNRLTVLLMFCTALLAACGVDRGSVDAGRAGHGPAPEAEPAKGPHAGRLLVDGDFTIELAIFEAGVPPEFRAWATLKGKPVAPDAVKLAVELERLDGERNRFVFAPREDFLKGDGIVTEPHSFAVTVAAEHAGKTHRWAFDSFEGRVTIPAASAEAAGIDVETAGPRRLEDVLPLYGRLVIRPDAIREVGARFPGTVRSVHRNVGDHVPAGEVLARIESNESLQVYAITAPISGVVTARNTNPGQEAGSQALFTVSDLTQVWVELSVFPRDLAKLRPGQAVRVRAVDGAQQAHGEIVRIAPAGADARQALMVWARLDDAGGAWTPGLYVNAEVLTGGTDVPLAVRTGALQRFRDFTVVFERVGETYEVRMLELGRRGGEYVEVLGGLKPGSEYVTANSFLIKADIEKSGASHDH